MHAGSLFAARRCCGRPVAFAAPIGGSTRRSAVHGRGGQPLCRAVPPDTAGPEDPLPLVTQIELGDKEEKFTTALGVVEECEEEDARVSVCWCG